MLCSVKSETHAVALQRLHDADELCVCVCVCVCVTAVDPIVSVLLLMRCVAVTFCGVLQATHSYCNSLNVSRICAAPGSSLWSVRSSYEMSSVRGAALCSAHSAFDDHDESRSVEEEEEDEVVVELGLTGEAKDVAAAFCSFLHMIAVLIWLVTRA